MRMLIYVDDMHITMMIYAYDYHHNILLLCVYVHHICILVLHMFVYDDDVHAIVIIKMLIIIVKIVSLCC